MTQEYKVIHKIKPFPNQKMRAEAYKELFKSDLGQKVLEDIAVTSGFYSAKLSQSERESFQQEGVRSVVAFIMNHVNIETFEPVTTKESEHG